MRYTELHDFAAKIPQTVEDDRETFGPRVRVELFRDATSGRH
jgi:hypothetical protein